MKRIITAIAIGAALAAFTAQADDKHHESALADGEVRKVDKDANKITLKHGPIQSINMPAMTMVFQVKDPAILNKVKAGDRVKFQAEMLPGGKAVVTRIEKE